MIRIYLDTNVYSYLKNSNDPLIISFHNSLIKYKSILLYCYSHGHLLDFKQDKTDKKYDDLDFIETLADNNYISYNGIEKHTSCYLAKPREAFEQLDDDFDFNFDFNSLFEIDITGLPIDKKLEFEKAKNFLLNYEFDLSFSAMDYLPDDAKIALSKFIPFSKSNFNFTELASQFMQYYNVLNEDKSAYKDLRGYLDKHLNNGKYIIDENNSNFNDDLKKSALKKTFIEFVNNSINPNGKKEITDYDFHLQAYTSLDFLGISKEPSRKAKFRSIFNDGMHSYYGAFCDYVISNDDDFIKKSKALYKLLGLSTKVLGFDEFAQSIDLIANIEENDISALFNILDVDINKGMVVGSKYSITKNRYRTTIKPFHLYLGFFNKIEQIYDPSYTYLIFTNQRHNYSKFSFYKEIETVTNKALKLFGNDLTFKGEFNNEIEIKEIRDNKWQGRNWQVGKFEIVLEINEGTGLFNLVLAFPKVKIK